MIWSGRRLLNRREVWRACLNESCVFYTCWIWDLGGGRRGELGEDEEEEDVVVGWECVGFLHKHSGVRWRWRWDEVRLG